jgi:RodZ C-terminal domain
MPRLRVRVELNRGGVGVPLHKLASVVHEAQRFFEMLADDVHIPKEGGEWLGFDFDNESLNFTAEFVGPVSPEQAQAFYASFDGTTSLRRATIAQFTQITEAIGEDELIGFGLYHSDQEEEPDEWRCLSRRDALRIADEIQLLLGVAGELRQETHLPAVVDSGAGARLFKERPRHAVPSTDKVPDLVREVESNLSKRITRLEDNMENTSQAIRDLRESSSATEESFKGLLNAVENFCGQATRQLERLSPAAELAAQTVTPPGAATAPRALEAPASTPAPLSAPKLETPAPASTPAPLSGPKLETLAPAPARRSWRAVLVAAAVVVGLVTAGLLWWPSRPSDSSGTQPGDTPSSVIASSQPAQSGPPPSPSQPPNSSDAKPGDAPQPKADTEKPLPMPAPAKPPVRAAAKPAPEETLTAVSSEPGADMHVEMEAQEPVWVMVTDKDGKILIARTLQPNETRTLEVGDNATLRTGNAGGLHVRLNGKDLGHLGPSGKIRDVQFKSGEFKVVTPDNI